MSNVVSMDAFKQSLVAAEQARAVSKLHSECPVCDRTVEPETVGADGELRYVCRGVEGHSDLEHYRFRWSFDSAAVLVG